MTDAGLRRLLNRITIDDGCWLWTGTVDHGYGRIGGRPAHRAVYAAFVGPIPEGHHIHHECGNKLCMRPGHLKPLLAGDHSRLHGEMVRMRSQRTMHRVSAQLRH